MVSLLGVATRAVAGELVVGVVGSRLGNALGAVLVVALVISLISVGLRWRARRYPQPASPTPPEEQPVAGVVENLPHVAGFVGREDVLHEITSYDDGAVAVVGRRGVGTSACVKKAALLLAEEAADGACYLNLRAESTPLPARQVVAALARRFGGPVPTSDDPAEVR